MHVVYARLRYYMSPSRRHNSNLLVKLCSYLDWPTFLSQHDPVGLTSSVLRLEGEVVECQLKPSGLSIDLKTTQTVDVGRIDVGVVGSDQVAGLHYA